MKVNIRETKASMLVTWFEAWKYFRIVNISEKLENYDWIGDLVVKEHNCIILCRKDWAGEPIQIEEVLILKND